jgi:predicted dehydrogenase
MRFLICGLGSIGRRHLRNLLCLGVRDIILLRTGKSTLPDDEFSDFPQVDELKEALGRWEPEAAIISNPTSLHINMALPAAAAGCHILIEKPISHSLEGLDVLESVLARNGKRALIGFQFRFHPGLQQVKRLLEEEAIGRVVGASANWGEYLPGWHPWEDYRLSYSARRDLGGGVLLTLCHPFDYMRWLIGDVEAVTAEIRTSGILEIDVEDAAEVILSFGSGAMGHVHLDYLTRPSQHWLEVIGSEGTLRWDNADGAVHQWSSASQSWSTFEAPEGFERNTMFLEEMRHFLEVIEGKAEPLCSYEDGVRALEIVMAAHRSARRGQRIQL